MHKNGNAGWDNHTATPTKYPQKQFKAKPCRMCGKAFQPKAPSNLYCSQKCADRAYASKYLERTYGIDINRYEEMLEEQRHVCRICGGEGFLMNEKTHKVRLVVDHCHSTGRIRGLLCHNCNRALGLLQDRPEVLKKAIEYLKVQRPSQ